MSATDDNEVKEEENMHEYQSDSDEGDQYVASPKQQWQQQSQPVQQQPRTMQRAPRQQPSSQDEPLPQYQNGQQMVAMEQRQTGNMGGRTGAIRESRIKDRPQPKEVRDSSLKIKIELDLEVEVDLYARVKGDVTIGLM